MKRDDKRTIAGGMRASATLKPPWQGSKKTHVGSLGLQKLPYCMCLSMRGSMTVQSRRFQENTSAA